MSNPTPPTREARKKSDHDLRVKAETLTCRHFNGVQHDCCLAGVNYRVLAGEPRDGCMTRVPCLPWSDPKHGPMAECAKHETWTPDEAEQHVTEGDAAMQRHLRVFRAAHDDAKAKGLKRGHGGNSSLVCPICAGTLRYAVASVNGHVHARCETDGCVSWME